MFRGEGEQEEPEPSRGWRKARRCSASTCVEVRIGSESVEVRDSKQNHLGDADQPIISVSTEQWTQFLDEIAGVAPTGASTAIAVCHTADGGVTLRDPSTGVVLTYDADEYRAFADGVRAGEFTPVLASA